MTHDDSLRKCPATQSVQTSAAVHNEQYCGQSMPSTTSFYRQIAVESSKGSARIAEELTKKYIYIEYYYTMNFLYVTIFKFIRPQKKNK